MGKPVIAINTKSVKVEDELLSLVNKSDELWIASPFFSYKELLYDILKKPISLRILVSLQYPTLPSLLRTVLKDRANFIETRFYDSNFHSKIFLFFKKKNPIAVIIGSSNFTVGGMSTNIETNVLIKDA